MCAGNAHQKRKYTVGVWGNIIALFRYTCFISVATARRKRWKKMHPTPTVHFRYRMLSLRIFGRGSRFRYTLFVSVAVARR